MSFAVFLDVDGVLSTHTTVERTPDGYTGLDSARIDILAKTIRKFGAHKSYYHLIGRN